MYFFKQCQSVFRNGMMGNLRFYAYSILRYSVFSFFCTNLEEKEF